MYVSPLYHLLVIYCLLIYLFIYFLLLSLLLLFICLPLFSLFLCSFFSINCFYLFDFFSSSFLFLFIGFACVSTAIQVLEKRVRIRSVFWSTFSADFSAFGLNTERCGVRYVFSSNARKCGEDADQNNSEYGLFLRRVSIQLKILFDFTAKILTDVNIIMAKNTFTYLSYSSVNLV